MRFSYSKLNGRIIEICGTQSEFARRMKLSERSVSLKLNGKVSWKQPEMKKALEVLNLNTKDVEEYFFTPEVQKF